MISNQPPFECENSCQTIIERGDEVYLVAGHLLCPDCARQKTGDQI